MANITPIKISELKANEIFVFGSNLDGDHAGGAAKFAVDKFGAKMGQYSGLQGQAYAIPTLSHPCGVEEHKLPLAEIEKFVKRFIEYAADNKEKHFLVTPIGCGIAGFKEDEIAPLFAECMKMDNVSLPQSFVDRLN